jgi:hypothetical protein
MLIENWGGLVRMPYFFFSTPKAHSTTLYAEA